MKFVSESAAAKSISAYIILNKKGKQAGKVQAHFSNSGNCLVNVWDFSIKDGPGFQKGTAGGYGYDRFTAAISGLTIDGHKIYNHSTTDETTKKILSAYHAGKLTLEQAQAKAAKIGASLTNYSTYYNGVRSYNFEGDKSTAEVTHRYDSLYYISGLDRLTAMGYKVIQAI